MGPVGRDLLSKRKPINPEDSFSWLKGILDNLFKSQGITNYKLKPSDSPFLEEWCSLEVSIDGKRSGITGIIKQSIAAQWRFTDPIAVAELKVEPLIANSNNNTSISFPGAYPTIERDIALIVDQHVKHEDIISVIKEAAPEEMEDINLFDIFSGKSIGPGKKSLAYSITYRSDEKTLTDEEANTYHNTIQKALQTRLGAQIRGED